MSPTWNAIIEDQSSSDHRGRCRSGRTSRLSAPNTDGPRVLRAGWAGRLVLDEAFGKLMAQSGTRSPRPLFVAVPMARLPRGARRLMATEPWVALWRGPNRPLPKLDGQLHRTEGLVEPIEMDHGHLQHRGQCHRGPQPPVGEQTAEVAAGLGPGVEAVARTSRFGAAEAHGPGPDRDHGFRRSVLRVCGKASSKNRQSYGLGPVGCSRPSPTSA